MRTGKFLPTLVIPAILISVGCAENASRQQVLDRLSRSESHVFPDEAVWMGDAGGYHHIHVRNIYNYLGDSDYLVPVSRWDLPDPFPLTDDADQWRNVQWEDKGALVQSRFAYVLLDSLERTDSPSVHAPGTPQTINTQPPPTTNLGAQQILPTTTPAPTTQPASQP